MRAFGKRRNPGTVSVLLIVVIFLVVMAVQIYRLEQKDKAYEVMVSHGNHRYEAVIEGYEETEEDMQFIFDGNYRYSSINWQTFGEGSYHVLVLNAQ